MRLARLLPVAIAAVCGGVALPAAAAHHHQAAPAAHAAISVQDAYIPQAPPNASSLAGYLRIVNHSGRPDTLEGVTSDVSDDVMIHTTTKRGAMEHMEMLASVPVPAGKTVVLAPGGMHLMLMDPKRELKVGDKVTLKLTFQHAGTLRATAVVKPR